MTSNPKIVPTSRIPHDEIDPDALKVIGRLRRFGHEAYLVGGCVRDLLLDAHPKDFDVITSARPRQVRRIFSNSRVIGRRFRLVHVIFGDNIIEVSTFRADPGQFAEKEDEVEQGEDDTILEGPDESVETPPPPPPLDETPRVAALTPLEQAEQISDEKLAPQDVPAVEAPREEPDERPAPARRDERSRPDWDGNNIFGTPEEDARRRDFTINALFYDPERREIIDYVDGLTDVERGLVNPINDPLVSFAEDPVRMIRAARFAAKLGFQIEGRALSAMTEKKPLITDCSQRRLLEEIFKILKGGHATACLRKLDETGLLEVFLPEIGEWLALDRATDASGPVAEQPAEPAAEAAPPPSSTTSGSEGPPATVSQTLAAIHAAEAVAPEPSASGRHPSVAPEPEPTPAAPPPEIAVAKPEVASDHAHGKNGAATGTPAPGTVPVAEPDVRLGPFPKWDPPARAIDAYLRVTWEHPPKEGPNDWVEDPHEEVVDAIFEASAFARDVVLESFGFRGLAGEPSERDRARAVMRVLHFNNRLKDAIAWVEEQERGLAEHRATRDRERRGRRGRRWRERDRERPAEHRVREPAPPVAPPVPAAGPSPSQALRRPATTRREVLLRYLEGLDKMMVEDVPLSTGVQLAALYAPMLREALERALEKRPNDFGAAETVIDDIMRPIALRHSLARRDRDRVKRIVLAMRRLLREPIGAQSSGRRRSRGAHRFLGKDYFQEALVLVWLHARATGEGWEAFRHWQQRALDERRRDGERATGDGHGDGDDADLEADEPDGFDDAFDDDGDDDGRARRGRRRGGRGRRSR